MTEEIVFESVEAALVGEFTGRRFAPGALGIVECFMRQGRLHRLDGPSMIERHPVDGTVLRQAFHVDGYLHRVGAPAVIYPLVNTSGLTRAEWYRRGSRHRIGGPAIERIRQPGDWYVNGLHYRDRADAVASLLWIGEPWLRTTLAETEFEALLDDPALGVDGVATALVAGISTPAGVREFLSGAPAEWVRAFESGQTPESVVGR